MTLGHALEVDFRPAFEKPLDQVDPKFKAVPWEREPLNPDIPMSAPDQDPALDLLAKLPFAGCHVQTF
jgi:hypothetical protein